MQVSLARPRASVQRVCSLIGLLQTPPAQCPLAALLHRGQTLGGTTFRARLVLLGTPSPSSCLMPVSYGGYGGYR